MVEELERRNIGIYGGGYGGFITLIARLLVVDDESVP